MRLSFKLAVLVAALVTVLVGRTDLSAGQEADPSGPVVADAGGHAEFVVHPDLSAVWDHTNLTYGFVNHTGDMTEAAQEAAVARAFASWASVTPLTFTEVADCALPQNDPGCTSPDIRIGFYGPDHGPDEWDPAFDGAGGELAHAFYGLPSTGTLAGDIHFDEAETWSNVKGPGLVLLQAVALHEIGHSLGVKHSDSALCATNNWNLLRPTMCESLMLDRGLAPDDVAAVRSLYGSAPGTTCNGFPITVRLGQHQQPTPGDDVIQGTSVANTISGGRGRDVICGGRGADTLNGGRGGDRLYGGRGRDTCNGGLGADAAAACEVTSSIP
jgi:hypothetical protein